jgi:hypothetical protein
LPSSHFLYTRCLHTVTDCTSLSLIREHGGEPSSHLVDELLDERAALSTGSPETGSR